MSFFKIYTFILHQVRKSFLLHTRHIQNIGIGNGDAVEADFVRNEQHTAVLHGVGGAQWRNAHRARSQHIALMMHYYCHFNVQPFMLTDEGIFIAACGDCRFDVITGQQVSLFNFGCQQLESQGLRWPIYPFDALWQGTLNEAVQPIIQIKADNAYLVYITWTFY